MLGIGLPGVQPGDGRLDRDGGRQLCGPPRHGVVRHDLTDLQVRGFGDVGTELLDRFLEVRLAQGVLEQKPESGGRLGGGVSVLSSRAN
jgi:hypothetical protein